ncbi:TolC family protein [Chitinophaga sp. MM2321]|uniref:TolC family protein n=1 Tax=Chitinophaga sp. MM2321 TaxID=3137178 RepID=UPI0032D58005
MIRTAALLLLFFVVWLPQVHTQDRSMQYYLEAGTQHSPLLKDYRNQVLAAGIDSMRVRAGYGPQLSGVSTNSYAPAWRGYGYDNAITNGGQVSALIVASRQFVGRKNLDNQLQAVTIQNRGTQNTAAITKQELKKNIIAQYITAYGDWAQYSFNADVLKLLKDEAVLLKRLTETGTYKQTDYLTFLVTQQQQELLIRQVLIRYQYDYAQLNYLCGLTDTTFHALPDPALLLEHIPELENTVFFRQFQIDSMQLENSNAQIDFSYRPKLGLYADGGFNSTLALNPYKNFGVSAGLTVSVPIYDGRQRKMQHDKIVISQQTRQGYQDFYIQQYQQQIRQLAQQLQSTQELIDQANIQIRYADGLMVANRRLLMNGDVRIADYIIAINNYLNAKNIITEQQVNKYQLINQLNYWNSVN